MWWGASEVDGLKFSSVDNLVLLQIRLESYDFEMYVP
jgi:hypothetical protein